MIHKISNILPLLVDMFHCHFLTKYRFLLTFILFIIAKTNENTQSQNCP